MVAWRWDGQSTGDVDVIEDGEVVKSYPTNSVFMATASGDTIGFVTTSGDVQTIWDDGERVLATGYENWYPSAVVGGPDCLDPETGGDGCRVFLEDGTGGPGKPTAVDSHGIEEVPAPDALSINGADERGRITVVTSITDDGSCGTVYDEGNGKDVFEPQCDLTLESFSPDGDHVLAGPAYQDGVGDGWAAVVDADTGEEVARIEPADGFVMSAAWVDADTIAVQVFDYADQTWTIQTLTIGDDAPQTVVGPEPGTDTDGPFALIGS